MTLSALGACPTLSAFNGSSARKCHEILSHRCRNPTSVPARTAPINTGYDAPAPKEIRGRAHV